MEAVFNSFNLGVTWEEFGDQDRSDLDDLLVTKNIHGEVRAKVVSLWKRHPSHAKGSLFPHSLSIAFTLTHCDCTITLSIMLGGLYGGGSSR
jgi:hypothetical protein